MYFNASRLQQRVPIKKISWGSMPPNPPSNLTAAPLDKQISVFMGKTQSHACTYYCVPIASQLYNVEVLTRTVP